MGQTLEKKLGSTFGLHGIFSRTKIDDKGVILVEYLKGQTTHILYADGGTTLITGRSYEYYPDADDRSPNREDRLAKKKADGITYIFTGGYTPFLFWNSLAAVLHLVNAIATPFGAQENQLTNMYPMYQGFTGWEPVNKFCNSTCQDVGYIRERVDTGENMVIQPALTAKRYSVSLLWLIFSFHLLSFIFQAVAGCCFKSYYVKHVLDNGVNSFRFIEYSISATLMLLCIALIGSLQDVYAHVGLGVLTTATMLFGLIAEILFSDEFLSKNISHTSEPGEIVEAKAVPLPLQLFRRARFSNEIMGENMQRPKFSMPKKLSFLKMKKRDGVTPGDGWSGLLDVVKTPSDDVEGISFKLRQLGWFAHICGWVTMGGAYGGILINHYFWSVEKAAEANNNFEGPPAWVTAIVFIIMGLYHIFGFTQLFQLCAKDPWCYSFRSVNRPKRFLCARDNEETGSGRDITCRCCCITLSLNEGIELFYVLNSLVTKTILGWVIISQLLVLDFVITDTVDCK